MRACTMLTSGPKSSSLALSMLIVLLLAGCSTFSAYQVVTESTASDDSDVKSLVVNCPPGTVVIGGGARVFGHSEGVALGANGPEGEPSKPPQWFAAAHEIVPQTEAYMTWGLRVDVFCAKVK